MSANIGRVVYDKPNSTKKLNTVYQEDSIDSIIIVNFLRLIQILLAVVFLSKLIINIFYADLVFDSFRYNPLYSGMEPTEAMLISTVGNLFFFLLGVVTIIATYEGDNFRICNFDYLCSTCKSKKY